MKRLFFILIIAIFTVAAVAGTPKKSAPAKKETVAEKLAKMPRAFRATFDAARIVVDDSLAAFKFAELIYNNYSDVDTRSKKLAPVAHGAHLGQISFEAIASMDPHANEKIYGDTVTVMQYHKKKAAAGDYSGLKKLFEGGLNQFVSKQDTNWVKIADYFSSVRNDSTGQ